MSLPPKSSFFCVEAATLPSTVSDVKNAANSTAPHFGRMPLAIKQDGGVSTGHKVPPSVCCSACNGRDHASGVKMRQLKENKMIFGGLISPYEYVFSDITHFKLTDYASRVGGLLNSSWALRAHERPASCSISWSGAPRPRTTRSSVTASPLRSLGDQQAARRPLHPRASDAQLAGRWAS